MVYEHALREGHLREMITMDTFYHFSCPACGKRLKAKREHVGKKAHCSCGKAMIVPTPGTDSGADLISSGYDSSNHRMRPDDPALTFGMCSREDQSREQRESLGSSLWGTAKVILVFCTFCDRNKDPDDSLKESFGGSRPLDVLPLCLWMLVAILAVCHLGINLVIWAFSRTTPAVSAYIVNGGQDPIGIFCDDFSVAFLNPREVVYKTFAKPTRYLEVLRYPDLTKNGEPFLRYEDVAAGVYVLNVGDEYRVFQRKLVYTPDGWESDSSMWSTGPGLHELPQMSDGWRYDFFDRAPDSLSIPKGTTPRVEASEIGCISTSGHSPVPVYSDRKSSNSLSILILLGLAWFFGGTSTFYLPVRLQQWALLAFSVVWFGGYLSWGPF